MMENKTDELNVTELRAKVYKAARDGCDGDIINLLRCVNDKSVKSDILNHHRKEGGQNTTPLIIAAKNGNTNVIHSLLNLFNDIVDLEHTGTVKFVRNFNAETCRGVTALWCAVAAQHFDIVKLIVEKGANINHSSINNSSALRVACLRGNLEIVKYLLNHDADVTIAYQNKSSCLMAACYIESMPIVKCLIDKGADLDFEDEYGNTALHIAAQSGNVELVKLLINNYTDISIYYNNAASKKNNFGVTPLMTAAAHGKGKVVDHLTGYLESKKPAQIETLELLGAFFTDKGSNGMVQAYEYMKEALRCRYHSSTGEISDKISTVQSSVFDKITECQTLHELETIKHDHVALHMESLLIRERLLGNDPIMSTIVVRKGDTFHAEGMLGKSFNLWLHALKLNQNLDRPSYHVCRFAQLFHEIDMPVDFIGHGSLLEVFRYVSYEVELNQKWLSNGEVSPKNDTISKMYEENILVCLCLIIICLRGMIQTADNRQSMQKVVYNFIKLNPALENGHTPLHIACQVMTPIIDNSISIRVPHPLLCKTLLDCGAKVNAQDKMKDTPLHVIAKAMNTSANTDILKDTLMCLIENGAHVDMCNAKGRTPIEVAASDYAKALICQNNNTKLMCLTSRVIKRHRLPYKKWTPLSLQEYVELH